MNPFSFIHCADIHLDSPLKGLGAYSQELADCFQEASRQAFINLVDAAIERKVAFVLIAGDIFDGDWRDFNTGLFFVKEVGRLGRAGIRVYAISGNHDAAAEMTKSLPLPDNLKFFDTKKPETRIDEATGVALHGQGFHDRWSGENIALSYPPPKTGLFNIGILHTACEGSSEHANYAPCSIEQLCNHGYDYWALGHVHGHAILSRDPYVVFPGNVQGRHVRECGPKGFCLVKVTDNEITNFERICCDVARWCDIIVTVPEQCATLTELYEVISEQVKPEAAEAESKPLAVRLTLQGATDLHWKLFNDRTQVRADIEGTLVTIADEVMLEKLRIKTTSPKSVTPLSADHQDMLEELMVEMNDDVVAEQLLADLSSHLTMLQSKIPRHDAVLPDKDELSEIIEEAKNIVTARLAHGEVATRED